MTGEFNEKGLTDDMEGLSPLQIGEIEGWTKFYDKEYTFVGKLIGRCIPLVVYITLAREMHSTLLNARNKDWHFEKFFAILI